MASCSPVYGTRVSEEHTESIFTADESNIFLRNVGTHYQSTQCHQEGRPQYEFLATFYFLTGIK
jgi:hypothetical protein